MMYEKPNMKVLCFLEAKEFEIRTKNLEEKQRLAKKIFILQLRTILTSNRK